MGYRSDVVVLMYAGTPEEQLMVNEWVKGKLLAERGDTGDPATDLKYCFYFQPNMVKFEVEGWKWYDSYEEVQWLENLFREYVEIFCPDPNDDNDNRAYAIEYMRVGENYEDVDNWSNGCVECYLSLDRTIVIDTD